MASLRGWDLEHRRRPPGTYQPGRPGRRRGRVRALGVDLLAVQEVDRTLARSGRADQPAVIAQPWVPAGSGPMPRPWSATTSSRCPAPTRAARPTATCWCRSCPSRGSSTCGSPAGGGEQRTALLAIIQVGSRPVTVAEGHLSNRQGHNVRQLRELQGLAGSRAAPRLLVGDLNLPSTVLVVASPAGLARDGARPDLPEFRPDPAARPHPAQ